MFDFIRRHTKILQFVLVLLIFPSFVFFGIQGYTRFTGQDQASVAKVGGHAITSAELDAAMRERIERARRQMPGLDAKLFDTPEMRRLALDALIRDRVLAYSAQDQHLVMTDDRLERAFKNDPTFAQLRNPDGSINPAMLAALGLSSEGFAQRLREDLSGKQVLQTVADTAIAPAASASAALDALYQQREVEVQRFEAKDFAAKVAPTDAQIEAYYKDPANAARFQAPEQASVEYVVLSPDTVKAQIALPEDDVRKYYEQTAARYTSPEERHASHILVKADKDAPKAERDAAKAKAEALLAEVKKDSSKFAEIAKKSSDDEGSAPKGGDLDWFGRGAMVPPFESAVFSMKAGEISPLVTSDFGYHVIRLDGVRGGEKKNLDAVRPEIENEIRGQLAQKRFQEAATEFGDTVYEQSDSLKPAADKAKLTIQKADRVTRPPSGAASGVLADPKFLDALFANEVVKDKRNTKAVELSGNRLVAGRVVSYTPSHLLPLADVKDRIRTALVASESLATARREGAQKLATAKAAPATALGGNALVVSRAATRDVPRALVDAVLKAPSSSLPAVVGVDLGDQGFAIARIVKVLGRDPAVGDPAQARSQYAQLWGDAEAQAYYAALKTKFDVSVSEKALARSEAEAASAAR